MHHPELCRKLHKETELCVLSYLPYMSSMKEPLIRQNNTKSNYFMPHLLNIHSSARRQMKRVAFMSSVWVSFQYHMRGPFKRQITSTVAGLFQKAGRHPMRKVWNRDFHRWDLEWSRALTLILRRITSPTPRTIA